MFHVKQSIFVFREMFHVKHFIETKSTFLAGRTPGIGLWIQE